MRNQQSLACWGNPD